MKRRRRGFGRVVWLLGMVTIVVVAVKGQNSMSVANIDDIAFIDCNAYPCTPDIGVGISAAYAALPPTGGTIVVPPGIYDMATPADFATAGKYVTLKCSAGDATVIHWVQNSGTMFVFNEGNAASFPQHGLGSGIDGCTLTGPGEGTSTIAVLASGSMGIRIHAKIGLFGIGVSLPNATNTGFFYNIEDSIIYQNTTGVLVAGDVGENTQILHTLFTANKMGLSMPNFADTYVHDSSFDDNENSWSLAAGILTLDANHYENAAGGAPNYGSMSGGSLTLTGGYAVDQHTTGTDSQLFTFTGGQVYAAGLQVRTQGATLSYVFNFTNTAATMNAIDIEPMVGAVYTQTNSDIAYFSAHDRQFALEDFNGNGIHFGVPNGGYFQITWPSASGTVCTSSAGVPGPGCPDTNSGILTGGSCVTAAVAFADCTSVVSLRHTEVDTNYAVSCTGIGLNGWPYVMGITSKETSSVTIQIGNGSAARAVPSSFSEIDCIVTR